MLNFKMRTFVAASLILVSFVGAWALDLPVRTIGGRQYYVYKVLRHDNVYAVADLLGLTRNDIVANNPTASQGLKEGQELFFPVEKYGKPADKATVASPSEEPIAVTDYKVKKGETVFGISKKFNTTPEVIYKLNPGAENGIKAGKKLKVPASAAEKSSATAQPNVGDVATSIVAKTGEVVPNVAAAPELSNAEGSSANTEVTALVADKDYTVVVMLPFMLGDEASRVATQTTEFYKGMLVAAEKFKNRAPGLKIIAVDTGNSLSGVRELLDTDKRLKDADVIIAPDNREQFEAVAEFGRANKIYVLNVANSRADEYLTNAYVMHGLIPSQQMLEKAASLFVDGLDGAIPVVLRNLNGKDDKKAFVEMVTTRLAADSIPFVEVEYTGGLSQSELEASLGTLPEGARTVFLPTSGTLGEFNRFATALRNLRSKLVETGGDLRLFGYPEWTTFTNEAKSALHELKTTIYARSYANLKSPAVVEVNDLFRHWYGEPMTEGVPMQGLMGYDLLAYLIEDMSDGDESTTPEYRGVQSSYDFKRPEGVAGVVNTSLYVVEFMPGDYENVQVK